MKYTVLTLIKLLFKEQSDQDYHSLLRPVYVFRVRILYLLIVDSYSHGFWHVNFKATLLHIVCILMSQQTSHFSSIKKPACVSVVSPEPLLFIHTKYASKRRFLQKTNPQNNQKDLISSPTRYM